MSSWSWPDWTSCHCAHSHSPETRWDYSARSQSFRAAVAVATAEEVKMSYWRRRSKSVPKTPMNRIGRRRTIDHKGRTYCCCHGEDGTGKMTEEDTRIHRTSPSACTGPTNVRDGSRPHCHRPGSVVVGI